MIGLNDTCQHPNCTDSAEEQYRDAHGNILHLCEEHYYYLVAGGEAEDVDDESSEEIPPPIDWTNPFTPDYPDNHQDSWEFDPQFDDDDDDPYGYIQIP